MSVEQTTVLVIEDDAMVRAWVRLALEGTEFRLVGEAASIAEGLELFERRRPELLLVDYRLPDGLGTELVRSLRQRGVKTPALLMTATAESGLNEAAHEAGAQGSVLKTHEIGELLKVLRIVRRGGESLDFRHPRRPDGRAPLSSREREVLRLAAAGKTNREISDDLGIAPETTKTLLARAYGKLGVHRRAEAVLEAHHQGLL